MNTTITPPTSVANLRAVLGTEQVFENNELDEILSLQARWQQIEDHALSVGVGSVDKKIAEALAAFESEPTKKNFSALEHLRLNRQSLYLEHSALNESCVRARDNFSRVHCVPLAAAIMRRAVVKVSAIVSEHEQIEKAAAEKFSVPFRPSDTLSAIRALANRLHLRVADLEAGRNYASPRSMLAELVELPAR